MSERTRTWIRRLLPVGVILLGALIMALLVMMRGRPERTEVSRAGALVEVITAQPRDVQVTVTGTGTVSALRTVTVTPQVSGRVQWVSPSLVAGGRFEEGEVMVRIEDEDYRLRVEQAGAQVAQAEYQLEMSRANARIARREWEKVREMEGVADTTGKPDALVLHEPQLKQAQAALASARAALKTAELNLQRTEIRAPFNCRVRMRGVSEGQVVGPQSQVAQVYGTDIVEIEVTMQQADLPWLKVPGARAEVILDTGEETYRWEGTVERTVGELSQAGRLARVVVRVHEPFARKGVQGQELALGSFVRVRMEGETVPNAVVLPRVALRDGDQVWIVEQDSTLAIREVGLHRVSGPDALVRSGVQAGDKVVLSTITGAAEGMKLRPVPREQDGSGGEGDAAASTAGGVADE